MRSVDVLLGGLSALSRSPMRTGLTMLGIAIGVSAMVSMAAISAGAQVRIGAEIAAFGANILMVNPGAIKKGGVQQAIGTKQTLTDEDADAIASLPNILAAAPSVSGGAQVVNGNSNWATTVNGTTLSHFAVRLWDVSSGRLFTREEEEGAAKVAVVGKIVAEKLFQEESPIGKIFRINDTPFKVVGVLKEKGSAGGGQSQDDVVFVPILTAKIRLIGTSNMISRSPSGLYHCEDIKRRLTAFRDARDRRRAPPAAQNGRPARKRLPREQCGSNACCSAIINRDGLAFTRDAGGNLFGHRWNKHYERNVYDSQRAYTRDRIAACSRRDRT